MKEDKPQVHIGTIGYVNHKKHTLTEAIKKSLDNKDKNDEYPYKIEEMIINNGGFKMVKGIKNYVGSTILGYRFVLNKNSSKRNRVFKEAKVKNTTMHNKVKVLNKRHNYSK